jgi:hypothetical protein
MKGEEPHLARLVPQPAQDEAASHAVDFWLTTEHVAGTSFFPSIGAVNPGLTAIANVIRVGHHIAERIGASIPSVQAPAPRRAPGQAAPTRTGTS